MLLVTSDMNDNKNTENGEMGMKKYMTITVPCYNSESYMRRCVDSLLEGGRDVEIILVDDGSTDGTARIADEYEVAFPDIVRVVHKKMEDTVQE